MVDGIGGTGAGRAAIDAAFKRIQALGSEIGAGPERSAEASGSADASQFADALREGLETVDERVRRSDEIHLDVVEGRLDLHEVAAQLKESEITFQFALQVRNKLLDAYREVMRMSV